MKNTEGNAARRYEYDEAGRFAKVTFEGPRGETAECAAGYAGYQETLDGEGFVLSRTFLSTGGKPVNTSEGYSEIRYQYDRNRQIRRKEYYDTNGALVKSE